MNARFLWFIELSKSSNVLLSDEFETQVLQAVEKSLFFQYATLMICYIFLSQLSDFGLAIWGLSNSSFLTDNDVVRTFGYLAPECFMYGKVSDKIDVYSFGVVLLELLSGRKPISYEFRVCQRPRKLGHVGNSSFLNRNFYLLQAHWLLYLSRVHIQAKLKLESGDLRSILDPILGGNIDEGEIQRMAIAVRLCITRSARLRPKMSQVIAIL